MSFLSNNYYPKCFYNKNYILNTSNETFTDFFEILLILEKTKKKIHLYFLQNFYI